MRLRIAALFTAAAIASATLLNCSIHTIKIFDGSKTYTVRSLNKNITLAMGSIALKSENYEILETDTSENITSVEISYGYPVYITVGENTEKIDFFGGTVEEALKEAGYFPDEFDFVEPALDTQISDTIYIDYTDIDYITTTEDETIFHGTETVYSGKLAYGDKKITVNGKDGVKRTTYVEKTVNGTTVSKKATETVTLTKAVDEKVTIGTKAENLTYADVKSVSVLKPESEIEIDENGIPVKYKSKMTVRATAYTYTGNKCATGVSPKPGYIAVNPKIIPYGTKMYIKTADGEYIYGYAVAADTGGFVKKHPTGVDLFFGSVSECKKFGVRSCEIYILE